MGEISVPIVEVLPTTELRKKTFDGPSGGLTSIHGKDERFYRSASNADAV